MTTSIKPLRMNHLNMVLDDFDSGLAHFQRLYDANLVLDLPNPGFHACLIEIGRTIFEIYCPALFLLSARYGEHYLGVEYQADMAEVRAAIAERGIRIVRDIDVALHTHPADTLGIAFEFWAGHFHDNPEVLRHGTMHPVEHWRDAHPLALTGAHGFTVAVEDLSAASAFLQDFLSARPLYEAARPAIGAQAIGLGIADSTVELLAPTGAGELRDHLVRYGQGIRSTVLRTRDMGSLRDHLAERQVALVPGTQEGWLAVPAEANHGVIFEFAE
jgi:hypothetical protein